MVFLLINPRSNLLTGGDGGTLAGIFLIPAAFFGGLVLITGVTGLPFWWIARPIAIGLETICVPVGWIALGVFSGGIDPVNTGLTRLLTGPLGLAVASVVPLSCLVLLTRPSSHAWFRQLRRGSG